MRVLQAPAKPQPIFRADYKPPAYLIDTVHLTFNLNEDVTHVTSRLALKPNYAENGVAPPLLLNGRDDVKLVGLKVAGACYHDKVSDYAMITTPLKRQKCRCVGEVAR